MVAIPQRLVAARLRRVLQRIVCVADIVPMVIILHARPVDTALRREHLRSFRVQRVLLVNTPHRRVQPYVNHVQLLHRRVRVYVSYVPRVNITVPLLLNVLLVPPVPTVRMVRLK